mmetsp:Transcript_160060/g.292175  ORF Transcript_160060/g.292175 Transcript_160060/m.292175 type:complete len:374 (+) Transcript_160060:106-1227(+)
MPGGQGGHAEERGVDDVQVMGMWNFTLQADTPLFWLRTGLLDRYLLSFRLYSPSPSTGGLIFHSEEDGTGVDGVSFWIERRAPVRDEPGPTKKYCLVGDGLESKPVSTRKFPDTSRETVEDIEVLVQGYQACILLQNRKVQIRCRIKHSRGSIAFFNSTKVVDGEPSDLHFSGCRVTALRRGPLEVSGVLGRRERLLKEPPQPQQEEELEEVEAGDMTMLAGAESPKGGGHTASFASTALPESPTVSQFSRTDGTTLYNASSPTAASPKGLRKTDPGRKHIARSASTTNRWNSGTMAATQPRLRHVASDSTLRRSGGALCGLTPASTLRGSDNHWVPLALNAGTSEQQILKAQMKSKRPLGSPQHACKDFIKM